MRKSNFALRLQPSLLEEARKLAQAEGVALNQLINVAVAEKLSPLRTESYFAERARRRRCQRRSRSSSAPAPESPRRRATTWAEGSSGGRGLQIGSPVPRSRP